MIQGCFAEPGRGVQVRMYPSLFREGVPEGVLEQCSGTPSGNTVPEAKVDHHGVPKSGGTVFWNSVPLSTEQPWEIWVIEHCSGRVYQNSVPVVSNPFHAAD